MSRHDRVEMWVWEVYDTPMLKLAMGVISDRETTTRENGMRYVTHDHAERRRIQDNGSETELPPIDTDVVERGRNKKSDKAHEDLEKAMTRSDHARIQKVAFGLKPPPAMAGKPRIPGARMPGVPGVGDVSGVPGVSGAKKLFHAGHDAGYNAHSAVAKVTARIAKRI